MKEQIKSLIEEYQKIVDRFAESDTYSLPEASRVLAYNRVIHDLKELLE